MRSISIFLILLLYKINVIAQKAGDKLPEVAYYQTDQFSKSSFTPLGSPTLSNFLSNISLSSTYNKGENGKAELKYTSKNWLTYGLGIDQKIGKNNNSATPFDFLNGLSSGTTVEFNLQKMIWNPKLSSKGFEQFVDVANSYSLRTGKDRRTLKYMQILLDGNKQEKEQIRNLKLKQPFFFNIKGSFTKTSFSYSIDSSTLTKKNENHFSPNITLSLGLPFSTKTFFALSYNYSEDFSNSEETTFFSPFGSSNNYLNQSISFGAPVKKTDNRINAEYRINFGEVKSMFAIGSSATYGFISKKIALGLPIYFINGYSKEGKLLGLQGGFKFGYITSVEKGKESGFKEGFAGQLIIIAPFDIFENL